MNLESSVGGEACLRRPPGSNSLGKRTSVLSSRSAQRGSTGAPEHRSTGAPAESLESPDAEEERETRNFGEALKTARQQLGLTQQELAHAAGVSSSTIAKLEQGTTHSASENVLASLRKVPGLVLPPGMGGTAHAMGLVPNCVISPAYDSLRMFEDMKSALQGTGGHIDQAHCYLDLQSAEDWLRTSTTPRYQESYRRAMPIEQLAQTVAERAGGAGVDVIALGPGDGAEEVRFVAALSDRLQAKSDRSWINFYLVDISSSLLTRAFRHARDRLETGVSGVTTIPILGNFHNLPTFDQIWYTKQPRLRVFLLFGYTMGNLGNEGQFFREVLCSAQPGDMAALDFLTAFAPPEVSKIRQHDPSLAHPFPIEHERWLSGPIRRHCPKVVDIKFEWHIDVDCVVPNSYTLEAVAVVRSLDVPERRFTMFRFRRYEADQLAGFLTNAGWQRVEYRPFNSQGGASMMLVEKSGKRR